MDRRVFVAAGLAVATGAVARFWPDRPDTAPLPDAGVPGRVRVSQIGRDGTALQRAIDTGTGEVLVDVDVTVGADVMLRSGQALRFVGGAIRVARDARIDKAVLYARDVRDVALIDPVIDASPVAAGATGIRLVDATGVRIEGGRLARANLMLESYNNAIDRRTRIAATAIDLQGTRATAAYLSGLRGVSVDRLSCANGFEGVGIYNGARAIRLVGVVSSGHRQDGFLVYAGQDISHSACRSSNNGQSGFTTQRDGSGEDSRFVTWTGCEAWNNGYDGFDMRGARQAPWGVRTGFVLSRCVARANGECGFYVVMAEGTRMDECSASRNRKQNLFIDGSDAVSVTGFRSVAGAVAVPPGPNKAGVLVYNSREVALRDVDSGNTGGGSQEFGVAFTGRNPRSSLRGGRYAGNRTAPFYADRDVAVADTAKR